MAQKQLQERMESSEREIIDLKEIILGLKKSVEHLAEEMQESWVFFYYFYHVLLLLLVTLYSCVFENLGSFY